MTKSNFPDYFNEEYSEEELAAFERRPSTEISDAQYHGRLIDDYDPDDPFAEWIDDDYPLAMED